MRIKYHPQNKGQKLWFQGRLWEDEDSITLDIDKEIEQAAKKMELTQEEKKILIELIKKGK